MSVPISITGAVKKYGEVTVIPDLTVKIRDGEFFTLLGPSGCGKTTLLRMIAGFASIEDGEIAFEHEVINNIPAHKRNIGMVFQNYAIFPHLTVRQNVEYGLKIRKVEKSERDKRVDEILDVVKIAEYQDRLPEHLSGGQQQRVALARAVVIHPSVLLMDEPLSNLDAKLRVEMRGAIREIKEKVGITTVYVTHDQEEALAISDRIAVMKNGVIQQIGKPEQIYARPYNVFVSTFIGRSNCFAGRITPKDFGYMLRIGRECTLMINNIRAGSLEGEVLVSVRPEEFILIPESSSFENLSECIRFTVAKKVFLGTQVIYELTPDDADITADMGADTIQWSQDTGQAEKIYELGERLLLKPNTTKINVFSQDGEMSLIQGVQQYG